MLTKSVRVAVEVPEGISMDAKESAGQQAREAAVLELWQRDEISTSLAAIELDLTYHEFLDLLTAKGLPVASGDLGLEKLAAARQKLAAGRAE